MDINLMLEAITKLLNNIEDASDIERLHIYSTIVTIKNKISNHVAMMKKDNEIIDYNSSSIYFAELETPLQSIVGLYNNGHSFEQNLQWCHQTISKLRSMHCFDL